MRNFFFIHIPKTAGASLRGMLDDVCGGAVEIDPWRNNAFMIGRTPHQMGHMIYDQVKQVANSHEFVTILRDPVERVISNYYYYIEYEVAGALSPGESILQFAAREPNYQTFFSGGDLSKFSFLGVQEHFVETIDRLSDWLDTKIDLSNYERKNVCHIKRDVSSKERDIIASYNQEDYRLYNEALKLLGYK
jgi:hypothetical protein